MGTSSIKLSEKHIFCTAVMCRGIWRGWGGGFAKSQPFRTIQKERIKKKRKRDADKSDKYTIHSTIN
jgi:hypothetical protein